jgi:hypothetical protein
MRTLKQIVNTPLSVEEIKAFLPSTPVILYADFKKMKTLPPVVVYLFLTTEKYGHWCCVLRKGKNVEFFDSYGIKPEGEHAFVSPEMLDHLKERDHFLCDLCAKYNWSMTYNSHTLQGPNTKTCGRHCVARVDKKDLSSSAYVAWLQSVARAARTTPDFVVSFLVP